MKKTLHCVFFLLAITLVPLQSVHALAIIADATGYNVGYVTDFWGVEFISGEGYITSVTFDVTSTGGYFDFDGSDFLDPLIPGVEPIIGATNGLSIGDIDFPRANGGAVGQPQILTFTFSPHSFTSGDWFRFSGDVDPIPSAGGGFGESADHRQSRWYEEGPWKGPLNA